VRNFQMLIVSAVKICNQCLQTVSARPSDPYRGFASGPRWGTSVPRPLGYNPSPNENSTAHCPDLTQLVDKGGEQTLDVVEKSESELTV